MSKHLIVVDKLSDIPQEIKADTLNYEVITVRTYIRNAKRSDNKVINLCRRYKYLTTGYYCSLFAEAREDRVIPSAKTLLKLSHPRLYKSQLEGLNQLLPKAISEKKYLLIILGRCKDPIYEELAKNIFDQFRCPLILAVITHAEIESLKALSIAKLTPEELSFFVLSLTAYTQKRFAKLRSKMPPRFYLAILENPEDPLPPSNKAALEKFINIGRKLNVSVELIGKKDYYHLSEYDALFIRETTYLNDHTYQFSLKAESEEMPVIDDPVSILRCTNKIYLAELFKENNISSPKTLIFARKDLIEVLDTFSFPLVLKIPDGNFSRGVKKVDSPEELVRVSDQLFENTELLIAQEFLYTAYDWRIGTLNQEPLFACKYEMSKGHWQTIKQTKGGAYVQGRHETLAIEKVPPHVIDMALKTSELIGRGLYGVDIKETKDGIYAIEVNDNPSIDSGVEDQVLKESLYERILLEFQNRLDLIRGVKI
ncbi:MAG: RimK family alpha-L-glutamate ligase [Candidatus Margulisbacteria bacterium]|nr:RimK family alpha-L-glutamate ligase [Candidatus Margulisiibacteriota bacterium]